MMLYLFLYDVFMFEVWQPLVIYVHWKHHHPAGFEKNEKMKCFCLIHLIQVNSPFKYSLS